MVAAKGVGRDAAHLRWWRRSPATTRASGRRRRGWSRETGRAANAGGARAPDGLGRAPHGPERAAVDGAPEGGHGSVWLAAGKDFF